MRKILRGFVFAFNGIAYAVKTQINFRIHLFAAISVTSAGFYFNLRTNEWISIAAAIGAVLVMELINTAIEILVDLVSPDYNEKAGIVKDVSAGAVLLTAITAVIIALFIFLPKMIRF